MPISASRTEEKQVGDADEQAFLFRPRHSLREREEGSRHARSRRLIAFGQFLEILIGGLLSGVLYSLVALGFVLIFKASGVFNFAQGAMVFFAALTYVGLLEMGLSAWLAVPATLAVMIVLA